MILRFLANPTTPINLLEACYVLLGYLTALGGKVVKRNYTLLLPSGIRTLTASQTFAASTILTVLRLSLVVFRCGRVENLIGRESTDLGAPTVALMVESR